MIILPAIDLLAGQCVRLRQGRYDRARAYSGDPVEVARRFEAAGARWIHLVDLDAARGAPGTPTAEAAHNRAVIRRIRRAVSCRLQAGGGIRSREEVEALLDAGVDRLVLGTVLVRRPEQVSLWASGYAGRLWAGIDADRGRVKISGWQQEAELADTALARKAGELGLCGIVYTSISRDGTLRGPDIEATNRVAEACGLPVILSGGIGGPEDVQRVLRQRHPAVEGIIVGKALYEGRLDLASLLARLNAPE